jgi:starch phosphorylase
MDKEIKVAYFSAEVGINESIKTYSGGLGILAGDTIKAMADLEVPFCAVTLLYKYGFFKQEINDDDRQQELNDPWDYENILTDTGKTTIMYIRNTPITIKIWKYEYTGESRHIVPIYFLDTHHKSNPDWAKELTEHLYVGDRIGQELLLGIGGYRALKELGHENLDTYHMNEGHSAFLTLEMYKDLGEKSGEWNNQNVINKCVFTTHTPIPAGHDKFEYSDFYSAIEGEKDLAPWHLKELAGEDKLNMTKLALSLSRHTNAVSRRHAEVTREMFPGEQVDFVTNGVHTTTWASHSMKLLFDNYIPGWRRDSTKLNEIFKVPNSEIFKAHQESKETLINHVNDVNITGAKLNSKVLTIGFARRFIQYKDAEMIFSNLDDLKRIGDKVQFIFAGKAHKNDGMGKEIMKRIIDRAKELKDDISIAFVENYNISVAKKLISGCDLWLNTPIPPNEASGTSGMKGALNGCSHFSRLDGWSIESYEMNGGGFPISDYSDFITTLEYKIIPMFTSENKTSWIEQMKLSIGNSGSYFNTHRMAKEYLVKAYNMK